MSSRTRVTKWDVIATTIGLAATVGVFAGCAYQLWPLKVISMLVLAAVFILVVWYQLGDDQ